MKIILIKILVIFVISSCNIAFADDANKSWHFYVHNGGKLDKVKFEDEKGVDFWTDSLLPFMKNVAEEHNRGIKRPTNNSFRYIPGSFGGKPTIEIYQKFGEENPASFQLVIIETQKNLYRPLYYRITDGTEHFAEAAGLTKNWGEWMLWVPNTYTRKSEAERYVNSPLFKYTEYGPLLVDRTELKKK